ncbi:multimerin-1-like [Narcine bancroftii]|uniref:multimerin-1-like n=1 Tax=Narcine bancroftii TaxID=1343680 RepID=UPI0038311757
MAVSQGRAVCSISVGVRILMALSFVFTLSKVCCVVLEAHSIPKWIGKNGSHPFALEQGRKLQDGIAKATTKNLSSDDLPVTNRYPQQANYAARGVNKLSQRQKNPSYHLIGGSKASFQTARGKNWCAYVHTRLAPTITIENLQSHVLLTSKLCVLKMEKCQPRYQIRNQPMYRIRHKIVTSLTWKCCPGYIGTDCQPKDYLKRQAENQAESQRTGTDLPKKPQYHHDSALAAKFNDKLYNQEIKLDLVQKKIVNISANVNDVWSLLYSLEGKINEANGKDLQSTSKGTKSRGIQELVKELVMEQIQSFQGNLQETVAELYKTISSLSEELQSTKGMIRELNETILSQSRNPHSTIVGQNPAPPSEPHDIWEQIKVLRADMSLACHNVSRELTEKHKFLERKLEGQHERIGILLETMNQTFSLARETPELHLKFQGAPEQEGMQREENLQMYLFNITENVKMHGRLILQLHNEVSAHEQQLFNLTSTGRQKEIEIRNCQEMIEECKSSLGSRLHQTENGIFHLNKTFFDVLTPLDNILEEMNERISNLSYDFEVLQTVVEHQGQPLETSTAGSGHLQKQNIMERLDNLSFKVASLSVFVKNTMGAHFLRNQSQGGDKSFKGVLEECHHQIEDGLNETMTVINDAMDSMRDDYYILKNNVTDLRRSILELFYENSVEQNHMSSLLPQLAQFNESFKDLMATVVRHQDALEMIGILQAIKDTELVIPPILMNVSHLLIKTTDTVEDFEQRIQNLEEASLSPAVDIRDYQSRIEALESKLNTVLASFKSLAKVKPKKTQGAKLQPQPPKYQALSRKVSGLQAKWTNLNDRISRMNSESGLAWGQCQNLSLLIAQVNASIPQVTMLQEKPNITALQQDLRMFVQTTSRASIEGFFTNITVFVEKTISNVVKNITKIQKQIKQLYKRPKFFKKANFTLNSGRSQRFADKITDPVESTSCRSAPCQNGGTCINQRKGFVCACRPPFDGPICDIKLLDVKKTDFSRGSYRYAPMVAFFVAHTYAMNTSGPIKFNHLYVNYGASYAPGSGKFSIPFLGVYVFKYTIESFSAHLSGYLVVDGVDKLAFQYEDTDNGVSGSRTVTGDAVLELNYGQSVWLRLTSGSIPEKFPPVTTFGGYLLYRT